MVNNITSLTGNGLKDWLLQRVSAVYLLFYFAYVLCFVLMHPQMDYSTWSLLFQCNFFKVGTVITLLMLLVHAWVGLWTVTTDYINHTATRMIVQAVVCLYLVAQLIWGIMILWGQ